MKKFALVVLLLAVVFLAGCGSDNAPNERVEIIASTQDEIVEVAHTEDQMISYWRLKSGSVVMMEQVLNDTQYGLPTTDVASPIAVTVERLVYADNGEYVTKTAWIVVPNYGRYIVTVL